MTRYDQLLSDGRALSKEERAAALTVLFAKPQAAALVIAVREAWEDYARAISKQTLASHHGCLEHCAGSLHGIETLENLLRGAASLVDKAKE